MKILPLFILLSFSLWASPREQAYKLHNRLTGVPPKPLILQEMTTLISQGKTEEAARLAIQHPNFYNIVLKNWIKPWSNREQTPRVPLNDYVATVIGAVRDDIPFDHILYEDMIYLVDSGEVREYSKTNNNHYNDAEQKYLDLEATLVRRPQSEITGLDPAATSGVITTRAAGEAFYSAGTNRRINRYTFMNFMCRDYEDLHDITIPDYRVRRDIERNPGGDSRTYKNKCVGCHAGQDALAGAFAYYDFSGNALVYNPTRVASKMNKNVYYPEGFVTTTDQWINTWATGQNASLGWRGPTQGYGVKSLNQMFARSRAFAECMASKVFKLVCLKDAVIPEDKAFVASMATEFESDGEYNLKQMIVKTSSRCVTHE